MGFFIPAAPNPNGGILRFCTRCGAKVEPYEPGSLSLHDFYEYGGELSELVAGQSSYWCSRCNRTWLALSLSDTGFECKACGVFMPLYVDYCGACGLSRRDR